MKGRDKGNRKRDEDRERVKGRDKGNRKRDEDRESERER